MNYDIKLKEIISSLNYRPKLLLHACCGPCSSYVLEYLSNYFDITILYYNPNIYPENEYIRRKEELKKFLNQISSNIKVIEGNYETDKYYNAVKDTYMLKERSIRCYNCYKLRLEETAKYAIDNAYDYFTTTLSISPYKNSEWLNKIGEELEQKYNIKYLYADFKKNNGYKRSLELSKEYNLYRQDYCGCKYSKEEREEYERRKQLITN